MATPPALAGRAPERAWLHALVSAAASGRSSVHVLEGEAGVGKSALIREAVAALGDQVAVIPVSGVEAEVDLPFGALQRVVLAQSAVVERMPEAARTVLRTATGLEDGVVGGRLTIGMALLALVTTAAEDAPAFVCVDDAQWIDEESLAALAFVAHRIEADRVVMLFARRPGDAGPVHLAGFPVRTLTGLDEEAAIELLHRVTSSVDRGVARQIVESTGGNPLALVELGAELTDRHLGGAAPLPSPLPLGDRFRELYAGRLRALPADTLRWLGIAAADPHGDLALIEDAARESGLPPTASAEAERARLVTVADRVEFRHPLIRAAVQASTTSSERRDAQRWLAGAAERRGDAARALHHRAAATDGVDLDLARDLEAASAVATSRGNLAAAARLLIRAAAASDPRGRAALLVSAAEASSWAGALSQVSALLAEIDEAQLDEAQRARVAFIVDSLRVLTFDDGVFTGQAAAFVGLSETLGDHADALFAVCMAVRYLLLSGELTADTSYAAVGALALARTEGRDPSPVVASLRAFGGLAAGAPVVGVDAYLLARRLFTDGVSPESEHFLGFPGVLAAAGLVVDDLGRDRILDALETTARPHGGEYVVGNFVAFRGYFDLVAGRLTHGRARHLESVTMLRLIGYEPDYAPFRAMAAAIRAWSGDPVVTRAEYDGAVAVDARAGYGSGVEQWRRAWLLTLVAQGDYDAAAELVPAWAGAEAIAEGYLLADLLEVAHHVDDRTTIERLRSALAERAALLESPTSAALLAWTRAVVDDDWDDVIPALEAARAPLYLGRAHLLWGERLRRARRRGEAAAQLERARAIFEREGARLWVERVDRELAPLDSSTVRAELGVDALTAQEAAVARLAADGETNAEIAARLFLSSNTVDYHLRKVFRKLDVTSRRQLRTVFSG